MVTTRSQKQHGSKDEAPAPNPTKDKDNAVESSSHIKAAASTKESKAPQENQKEPDSSDTPKDKPLVETVTSDDESTGNDDPNDEDYEEENKENKKSLAQENKTSKKKEKGKRRGERGKSALGTNSRSKLSFGAQQTLLKLILDSGGFTFLDKRLPDLLDSRKDLFGKNHWTDPIRRSAKDKVKQWQELSTPQLNQLISNFKLSPLGAVAGGAVNISKAKTATAKDTSTTNDSVAEKPKPATTTASTPQKEKKANNVSSDKQETSSPPPQKQGHSVKQVDQPEEPACKADRVEAATVFGSIDSKPPTKIVTFASFANENQKKRNTMSDKKETLMPSGRYTLSELDFNFPQNQQMGFRLFILQTLSLTIRSISMCS